MAGQKTKRKDKDRIVLRKGECQRPNGTYDYRWTDLYGKRHTIYGKTLEELREKEKSVSADYLDGIKAEKRNITVNELFDSWCKLKRGLKDNTFQNYKYMYNTFVRHCFGKLKISQIRKSDVKRFYNSLADERGLQASTIDGIHTVLHQVFDMAVDDEIIRANPTERVLKELKQSHCFQTEKRRALTVAEQELFLDFMKNSNQYRHWYPVFAVMLGSGLRVGEVTGLRWCDIDLDEGLIDVNHTLVYYTHGGHGCSFGVNTPKTKAGERVVPMLGFVKDAFLEEQRFQEESGIKCTVTVDRYSDFIFVNRFGEAQHCGTLNKAIQRIIRDCNDAQFMKNNNPKVLLPHFSCHSLRHTFTTRMCEAGVNIKVIQDALGHADVTTTLGIYADVTKDLRKNEFEGLDKYFQTAKNE